MIVTPDGKAFRGFWWAGDAEQTANGAGTWDGKWQSAAVGSCPHWSGSVAARSRSRSPPAAAAVLHGILFDLDSATLRARVQAGARRSGAPARRGDGVEAHHRGPHDASGAAAHNQTLSEQRAASVKAYLVSQGVDAARLSTAGFGASRPVADNGSELGRAQNRRVELVKR
jgi:outer membrane protein OmpA-like peptidoglycan-associated protein